MRHFRPFLLLSLCALLLACGSEPQDELSEATNTREGYTPGVPGGVSASIMTIDAQVSAVDPQQRRVTLIDAQGNQRELAVNEPTIDLQQVQVGDQVRVEVAEEVLTFMQDENTTEPPLERSVALKSPEGSKPAVLIADTDEQVARIMDVDLAQHRVTVRFADGSSKSIGVRPDVVLSPDVLGRDMVIRTTTAMALTVTPQ